MFTAGTARVVDGWVDGLRKVASYMYCLQKGEEPTGLPEPWESYTCAWDGVTLGWVA